MLVAIVLGCGVVLIPFLLFWPGRITEPEKAKSFAFNIDPGPTLSGLPKTASNIPQTSVANELEKLGELRSKGVLTDEEFQKMKTATIAKAS